mgnify:CR=1 FL=1
MQEILYFTKRGVGNSALDSQILPLRGARDVGLEGNQKTWERWIEVESEKLHQGVGSGKLNQGS